MIKENKKADDRFDLYMKTLLTELAQKLVSIIFCFRLSLLEPGEFNMITYTHRRSQSSNLQINMKSYSPQKQKKYEILFEFLFVPV